MQPNLFARLAPWLLDLVELVLLLAAGALILLRRSGEKSGNSQPAGFLNIERAFVRLARRKTLSIISVGLLVLVLRAALIPVLGIPQPRWNDEFGYLLEADTFAHGRVTNPPHPMWVHFESFHIIQHPTYTAMYAPGQGLVLAFGQLLGHPWIGQYLLNALMCSALCWMLQAWVPPKWALLGGLLAALRLAVLSYWMNSYWCGALAALGGALVFGALPRLRRRIHVRDALVMAAGVLILANSRPYEGLIFSLPVAAAMCVWLWGRDHPPFSVSLPRVVLPMVLVLAVGAAGMGYYYWRVTGSPFRMTYQVNRATYAMAPYFLWQTPRPEPVYHHAVMRQFYEWELQKFEQNRTLKGAVVCTWEKISSSWRFYFGPIFTLPLVMLPWAWRDRRLRFPLITGGVFLLGIAVETWTMPHYVAPATAVIYIVIIQCMRHLHVWRRQEGTGVTLVRTIPVIACAMVVLRVVAAAAHVPLEAKWPRGNLERPRIIRQLEREPRKDLVLVRYEPGHDVDWEWVYNDADIDASPVVWARDMGPKDNRELLQYFHDRRAWVLDADQVPARLEPYTAGNTAEDGRTP